MRHRIIALGLALGLLYAVPAKAGDSVEIGAAVTNINAVADAEEIDGQGPGYSVAYNLPVGKTGRLAARFDLTRVDGVGDADQGGYAFGAGAVVNFGDMTTDDGDPVGLFSAYLRGDLGVTWADTRTVTEEVPAGEEMIEIDLDVSEQYVVFGGAAGFRLGFGQSGMGVGGEVTYRTPASDGVSVEDSTAARIFFWVPATGQ